MGYEMIAYNEKVAKDIIAYEISDCLNGIIISGDLANKLAESAQSKIGRASCRERV